MNRKSIFNAEAQRADGESRGGKTGTFLRAPLSSLCACASNARAFASQSGVSGHAPRGCEKSRALRKAGVLACPGRQRLRPVSTAGDGCLPVSGDFFSQSLGGTPQNSRRRSPADSGRPQMILKKICGRAESAGKSTLAACWQESFRESLSAQEVFGIPFDDE